MKKKNRFFISLIIFGLLSSLNLSCTKDNGLDSIKKVPLVSTTNISNVTSTSVICGGNVISDGGSDIVVRGVCWSKNQNPIFRDSIILSGKGIGGFTSAITGLTPNTTYYLRAFASNTVGTVYGELLNFTTSDSVPPVSLQI